MIKMLKDVGVKKVLLLGSGPMVIGQGNEYDVAALEVCQILHEAGCKVVVVNSNPASLATDPGVADQVYLIPLTVECIRQTIDKEQPDLILAGFGGQNALHLLSRFQQTQGLNSAIKTDISTQTLEMTQDRGKVRKLLTELGLNIIPGGVASSIEEGRELGLILGFPLIIKPSFSMAGLGSALVYNQEELEEALEQGLSTSVIKQVSVEKAFVGWKEFECELLRDCSGKMIFAGMIDKMDTLGVHSGNSISRISPVIDEAELRKIMELAGRVLAAIGTVGMITLKIAYQPVDREIYLLDLNPRYTSNSALTTAITGSSMAVIGVKLVLGYSLNELFPEEMVESGMLKADRSFTALKLPYFDFRRFPGADPFLGPSVKAIDQLISLGGNFKEALQKGLRTAEGSPHDHVGIGAGRDLDTLTVREIKEKIINPNKERFHYLYYALKKGLPVTEIVELAKIDPSLLKELTELIGMEKELNTYALYNLTQESFLKAKCWGYSDRQLARLLRVSETALRNKRQELGINPVRKNIGRGNISFLTYELNGTTQDSAAEPGLLIIGSGPGGNEFDWGLVHAVQALKEAGQRVVVVNTNPASIALVANRADRIYVEPFNMETLLTILQLEKIKGVSLQFGGKFYQETVKELVRERVPILGTSAEDLLEILDPVKFRRLLDRLHLNHLGWSMADNPAMALEIGARLGYPLLVQGADYERRPVVRIVTAEAQFRQLIEKMGQEAVWPMMVEKWISDAIGVSVDCVGDEETFAIAGIGEQIETAEVHPDDSALSFPPYSIDQELIERIIAITRTLIQELAVRGPVNLRLAIKHDTINVLEINPWAASTMVLASKASGVDWPAVAARVLAGRSLRSQQVAVVPQKYTIVKEAVFSFMRFPGVDTVLGPEKRSSGMVMGIDTDFGMAFVKSQLAAGENLPVSGQVYLSIRNEDKRAFIGIARQLADLGFQLVASDETAAILGRNTVSCKQVYLIGEGRPNILDLIKNGEIQWIINTPSEAKDKQNEGIIRSTAVLLGIPMVTTLSGALAVVNGLKHYISAGITIVPLNHYFKD